MKKIKPIVILFLIVFTSSTFADKIVHTYKFEKPQLKIENGYTEIVYSNCYNYGDEGNPLLPYLGTNFLLSQNQEIGNIKIVSTIYYPYKNGIKIKPASREFPTMLQDTSKTIKNYKVIPNSNIYNSSKPYPDKFINRRNTYFLNGHSIGVFSICPIIYIPSKNRVKFVKEITIEIETKTTDRAQKSKKFLRNSTNIEKRIRSIVINPEMLKSYNYSDIRDRDRDTESDILLITNNELLPAFNDYIEFKECTGFIVSTMTVEDIYNQYTGDDNQTKIRNCIIDYYTNHNISYVILGGDSDTNNPPDDIIPHRGFYVNAGGEIEPNMPSDMYYSNLDGTWNDDGDDKWGEPGEIDPYAEVCIGRICVDDTTEIINSTNKLQMYQDSPVIDDIEKALMLGEQLNSYTYGGDYKNEVADGSSNNGYTTVGISDNFTVTKLYDMNGGWDKNNIFDQFDNTGINLLNHLGHSSNTYNMKMYTDDLTTTNFTNDGVTRGFVIGYSQGCYNGSFDNWYYGGYYLDEDCFAEKITTMETGEAACIANSRYGWYEPGGTNSSSQYYDRQFYDAIFGQNQTMIGQTNRASKEKDVSQILNDAYMRWTAYGANLLGDPSMDIWTAVPTAISATYPLSIPIGTIEIPFETDAPYARIGLQQNNELIGRAVADSLGNATVNLFSPISEINPIDVSIIAHNRTRLQDSIIIITNQPYIIYNSNQIDDESGNNNGLPDFGESIDLSLCVKNVGDQPASNVNVTLSSDDPYVVITDSTEDYGDIPAGDTTFIEDAFAFDVSDSVPDQHIVAFNVIATDELDSTWTSSFSLTAYAPVLSIGNLTIDDTDGGNGNGRLDPGETANIIIESSNFGHSDCFGAYGILSCTSSYITIPITNSFIGTIAQDSTEYAAFTVEVDPLTPLGTFIDLTYNLTSGLYNTQNTFNEGVGLTVEDWETGDFSQFNWSSSTTIPWGITINNVYEGNYCVKSGDIGNSESTDLILTYNDVMYDDSISFFRKVSSEPNHDYLKFYIDNYLIDYWSGEKDWERISYPVTAGNHTFKWVYSKDNASSGGSDHAWIDYIVLPPQTVVTVYAGPDDTICEASTYTLSGNSTNYSSLNWTTSGDGTFDNDTILTPVYTPGTEDIAADSVILTLTAYDSQGEDKNDDMILYITPGPTAFAGIDTTICQGSSYTVIGDTATNYISLNWNTSGDGTFNDTAILNPIYIPGQEDIDSGSVILSLSAKGNLPCGDSIDDMILTIYPIPSTPGIPEGLDTVDLAYTNSSGYTTSGSANASSYLWELSPPEAGTITGTSTAITVNWSGLVGDAFIKVKGINYCGESDFSEEYKVTIINTTGFGEDINNLGVKLYPNPNKGSFTLEMNSNKDDIVNIKILNSFGIVVFEKSKIHINGKYHKTIDLNNFSDGIYMLFIENNKSNTTKKIIIQK